MTLRKTKKKYWTCKRCAARWERTITKCRTESCAGRKPKPRVAKHAVTLRDHTYDHYVSVNHAIHGVGDQCAVCGRERSQDRKLDRDHSHTTGQPRGLTCVTCNILMPRGLTAVKARQIADYLTRVHSYYQEREAA